MGGKFVIQYIVPRPLVDMPLTSVQRETLGPGGDERVPQVGEQPGNWGRRQDPEEALGKEEGDAHSPEYGAHASCQKERRHRQPQRSGEQAELDDEAP